MRAIDADNVLLRITSEKEDNWKSCKGKPNEYDIGVNNGLTLAHAIVLGTTPVELPRWTPVEERLPEKGGYYLVHHKHGLISQRLYYEGQGELFVNVKHDPVTHWMPLPDAPKEE